MDDRLGSQQSRHWDTHTRQESEIPSNGLTTSRTNEMSVRSSHVSRFSHCRQSADGITSMGMAKPSMAKAVTQFRRPVTDIPSSLQLQCQRSHHVCHFHNLISCMKSDKQLLDPNNNSQFAWPSAAPSGGASIQLNRLATNSNYHIV